MPDKEGRKQGLAIDVKNCTTKTLGEIHRQLEGSNYHGVLLEIRTEIVVRFKAKGKTTQQVVDLLVRGVPKGLERDVIAEGWAAAIGLSVSEFKRRAGVT